MTAWTRYRGQRYRLPIAVIIGLAVAIACLWLDARTAWLSYLSALVTASAISLGALGVLMMSYLVRGHWTETLHRPLTAAALTLPLCGALFVPVLLALPWIYPWAHDAVGPEGPLKPIYLTTWFFSLRTVFYFVVWTGLALWVRAAWGDDDRMKMAASAGLIVYALTASFAGIDWIESLTPDFHSSIYGLLFLTFQLLAGLAFALWISLSRNRPLGSLYEYSATLIAVLLLWAYNHAMQYIIIWSGNMPEEVVWYLAREDGFWMVWTWGLMALQFLLPFFAMLSAQVRNGPRALLVITATTLVMRFAEAIWLIMPGQAVDARLLVVTVPAAALAIGGLWFLGFLYVSRRIREPTWPLRRFAVSSSVPARRS